MNTYSEAHWRTQGILWHPVQLVNGGLPVQQLHWLFDNVGSRGVNWIYPETHTLCFRSHDHAVMFSLTWCGS